MTFRNLLLVSALALISGTRDVVSQCAEGHTACYTNVSIEVGLSTDPAGFKIMSFEETCKFARLYKSCMAKLQGCENELYIKALIDTFKSLPCGLMAAGTDCNAVYENCLDKSVKESGLTITDFSQIALVDKEVACKFRREFKSCVNKYTACKDDITINTFVNTIDELAKQLKCGCATCVASLALVLVSLFLVYNKA